MMRRKRLILLSMLAVVAIAMLALSRLVQPPVADSTVHERVGAASRDRALATSLRHLLAGSLSRRILRPSEHAAVSAFYRRRGFAPQWIADGGINHRARAAIDVLQAADADGLDPADYAVPHLPPGAAVGMQTQLELWITGAVLAYARHAMGGRIRYSQVSADIGYRHRLPRAADILAQVADTANIVTTMASWHPSDPHYQSLRHKLAELRAQGTAAKSGRTASIPAETQSDAPADQVRGGDIATIIVNMERWRWLPRDLGANHVLVNIPAYQLEMVQDGVTTWRTRIVVGVPRTPTPIMSADMTSITLNPIWNVPRSIVDGELRSTVLADPLTMERLRFKTVTRADGTIHVYQLQSPANPLGQIRFNFPNKFAVYQHDTPDKYLFEGTRRQFSHGCMRVDLPLSYAEKLLSIVAPGAGYSRERIYSQLGSDERNIDFPIPVPVHLTYQTALVDAAGALTIFDDIYGYDRRMIGLLHGANERATPAIVAPQHRRPWWRRWAGRVRHAGGIHSLDR